MKQNSFNKSRVVGIQQGKQKSFVEDKQLLKKSLLDLTEQRTEITDKQLDRNQQKIELLSGEILDLEKLEVISKQLQVYQPRFEQSFYLEIFRLNNWDVPENGIVSEKPNIVGTWTKEIIYGRFKKNILPTLELLNPYERIGLRKHKHHQFLNDEGLLMLTGFIKDAIELMKKCTSWYEFRQKLYAVHGVPYQMDAFEEQKKVS